MRNSLIVLVLLGLIIISGCASTTSKYSANDFISAISVKVEGIDPQTTEDSSTTKEIYWNISNKPITVTIDIKKDSASAIKYQQTLINLFREQKYPSPAVMSYEKKEIFGQEVAFLEIGAASSSLIYKNDTRRMYLWSKDNFAFHIEESNNVNNSHLDELATRIIGVYNK